MCRVEGFRTLTYGLDTQLSVFRVEGLVVCFQGWFHPGGGGGVLGFGVCGSRALVVLAGVGW